jgi:hypothetical protein
VGDEKMRRKGGRTMGGMREGKERGGRIEVGDGKRRKVQ